jgi:hypothetical protein
MLVIAAVAAATLPLSACATAQAADAQVVVRIRAATHPADYEVHLAHAGGGFRTMERMRSGQTRTFAVPAGWTTVRIPGVCVVPTAAAGITTIEVRPNDCRLD